MEFFTIGVYHTNEPSFFNKLADNGIDTFCDVRLRRGVRGAKYTFANSIKLQQKLEERGINYHHEKALAPSFNLCKVQTKADAVSKLLKRDRMQLDVAFISAYKNEVMHFDFDKFIQTLSDKGAKRIVLFCVEQQASACHRSVIASLLNEKYQFKITNL